MKVKMKLENSRDVSVSHVNKIGITATVETAEDHLLIGEKVVIIM